MYAGGGQAAAAAAAPGLSYHSPLHIGRKKPVESQHTISQDLKRWREIGRKQTEINREEAKDEDEDEDEDAKEEMNEEALHRKAQSTTPATTATPSSQSQSRFVKCDYVIITLLASICTSNCRDPETCLLFLITSCLLYTHPIFYTAIILIPIRTTYTIPVAIPPLHSPHLRLWRDPESGQKLRNPSLALQLLVFVLSTPRRFNAFLNERLRSRRCRDGPRQLQTDP